MQDGKIARVFDSEQEIRSFANAHLN
jgi:hypothetical protein